MEIELTTERGRRDFRRSVMAAMETGNHETARGLYREAMEYDYVFSVDVRADVLQSYGIELG